MKIRIAFIQLLPGKDLQENLEIGKKACAGAREKGADIALFPEMWSDGYYLPQDETELKDKLRTHRSGDIMGDKYRHPGKYGILSDPSVRGVIGGEFVHW